MKNRNIILILVLFLIASCQKERIRIFEPGDMKHGEASAKKGNKDWSASGLGVEEDWSEGTVSVLLNTFTIEGALREQLNINEIPLNLNHYQVGNSRNFNDGVIGSSYGIFAADGDVVEDHYILDTVVTTNFVEVMLIDTINKKIEGLFDVSFVINPDREKTNPENPDEIRFSRGTFSVDIID